MTDLLEILPTDKRKWTQPQCSICGKFISNADLEDEYKTFSTHVPEAEFQVEDNYWTHASCEAGE